MNLSFILPARNEEANLPRTIADIRKHVPEKLAYEVIVVDHGSDDRTAAVSRDLGAMVLDAPGVPLGELRNVGARAASGFLLVFLDADVSLTSDWGGRIESTVSQAVAGAARVTGSWCEVDRDASWIDWVWETGQHRSGAVRALGGAHLIVPRNVFWEVGGFPSGLHSGEDEEICRAAWAAGVPVISDPALRVIHRGVARTLWDFFRRHRWHALAELRSCRGRSSVTALASLAFEAGHAAIIAGLVLRHGGQRWVLIGAGALVVLGLPLVKARRAWRAASAPTFLALAMLYYLYFHARASAWIAVPLRRTSTPIRAKRFS